MGMGVHSNTHNLVGTRPPFNPANIAMAVSVGGEQSVISGHREFAIISWVKPRRQRRFAVGFHSASGDMRGHALAALDWVRSPCLMKVILLIL